MSKILLETLCVKEGQLQHLSFHQKRLEHALKQLQFNVHYDLKELLSPPNAPLLRCRVLYSERSFEVSYHTYEKKQIQTLQLIEADTLDYALKYADRDALNRLAQKKKSADDILIVQNDLITDTSIANIAFYDGSQWITPQKALLKGTTRTRLLAEKRLVEAEISVDDIKHFEQFALMNAMIGFEPVKNGIILPMNYADKG